jgi:hypothetical protein
MTRSSARTPSAARRPAAVLVIVAACLLAAPTAAATETPARTPARNAAGRAGAPVLAAAPFHNPPPPRPVEPAGLPVRDLGTACAGLALAGAGWLGLRRVRRS